MTWSLHRKIVRRLRASARQWSPKKDRDYHDALFAAQDYDPFCISYPGNITIRRFADLASPCLERLDSVLDLGCGTGEITCELARRFSHLTFLGVDHSEKGIKRAGENAQSLRLANISFFVGDIESYLPERDVDIVLMFDTFHHIPDPKRFIDRFGRFSTRFLLIEPRGDWKGSWRKDVDFDWLILELEKIRARVAYLTGEKEPIPRDSLERHFNPDKEPIENRYTLDDFRQFFSGYGLDIRGTVSGLDVTPPDPLQHSPSRERFGNLAYDLYKEIDDLLLERNLDLLAKHWVIYAERNAAGTKRKFPRRLPEPPWATPVKGPYDVEYVNYDGPKTAAAGDSIKASVRIKNRSFRVWSSSESERPDYLSYHWLNKRGSVVIQDGERSPLPRPVGPDEECDVSTQIKTPGKPGRYILAVDLVRENTAWFSDGGSPFLQIPFQIRK